MNVELLQRIKNHILEEPKRLNMSDWGRRVLIENGGPACGTVACIAGWAALLSRPELLTSSAEYFADFCNGYYSLARIVAKELLELSPGQEERLFFVDDWPVDLMDAYNEASLDARQNEMAFITAERIDRFVATNGFE